MTRSITDVDFSQLAPMERILLAQDLWESAFDEVQALPLTAEQEAEIKRRIAAVDAGTMPLYDWREVHERLLRNR
jgi:putative addiction module component (TIGR02574 family)